MSEFLAYSPEDVIVANLDETDGRMRSLCEQEAAHLRELAAEIVSGAAEVSDLIASLPEHRPPEGRFEDVLPENRPMLEHLYRMRGVWKNVLLCTEIERLLNGVQNALQIEDFWEEATETDPAARGRVIYQRNSYADSAYLRFAEILPLPRAVYTHSFNAVCEEVLRGNCEYCILPLENSTEGPLNSFARLIDQYELRIAATCNVPTTDGTRITRFALLCRELSTVSEASRNARRFFDFSLPVDLSPSQESILYAAACCGLVCNRIDSRAHRNEGVVQPVTQFSFFADSGNLRAFLLYLAMEAPQCNPVGYYAHLT